MGLISACFCVFIKQGTPNDGANIALIIKNAKGIVNL